MFDHLPICDRLALLDPDAYDFYFNDPWDLTVPQGETWYALNIWWATVNNTPWVFHRKLDAFDPYMLPQGTNIRQPQENIAFAYICRPSKVAVPMDPESKLAARLSALRTMPLNLTRADYATGGTIAGNSVAGALWEPNVFPSSFRKGMLRHCATHDGSWTILVGNVRNGLVDAMNTLDEISDYHAQRFTGNIMCPFSTSVWNGIWVKSGNYYADQTKPSLESSGVVTFNKLADDW